MGKSLHETEEKQRRSQPPCHAEPLWDRSGKAEEVVDVIHHHGNQGNPFQPRLSDAAGFSQCLC